MSLRRGYIFLAALFPFIAYSQQSRNGEYHAQSAFEVKARSYPEHTIWSTTIVANERKPLYTVRKEIPYDVGFPAVYVSDFEGSSILVSSFSGEVGFYNGDGKKIRSLFPFGKETAVFEQKICCSLSGKRAAFLISSPEMQNAIVFVTDLDGNELWRATLPEKNAADVFLSDDMQFIFAGSFSSGSAASSHLFDGEGKLLRRFDSIYRSVDIDQGTRMLALANRGTVLLTSIDGSRQAHWISDNPTRIVTSIRFFRGNCAIVSEHVGIENQTNGVSYNDPELVVTDLGGRPIQTKELFSSSQVPAQLNFNQSWISISSEKRSVGINTFELKSK